MSYKFSLVVFTTSSGLSVACIACVAFEAK